MTVIDEVEFRPRAAKAFIRLSSAPQAPISRELAERRAGPHVPADRMRGIPHAYRPKLRTAGIRVVYQVLDDRLLILVLSAGERDREKAFRDAIREYLATRQ